jgi:DNA-binding response OmpR family regulator
LKGGKKVLEEQALNKPINGKTEKTKILVVDDNAQLCEAISVILSDEGYDVTTAHTGKEALEVCNKNFFTVGLIDINLPDISGTVVLQTLKTIWPTMIKIIITGYPSLDNAVQSLNLGAEGYIIKPFKPEKLIEQIQKQIEKHQVENWENLLKTTGLSAYEAKIYLALTLNGTSEPRKLSLLSGVPRTKTYVALNKLLQKGMVSLVPGAMQKFAVSAPADSFKIFVQSWKQELTEQEQNLQNFETEIANLEQIHVSTQKTQKSNIQREDIWVIEGAESIQKRIAEFLAKAKKSVYLSTNEAGLICFYKFYYKVLDQLSVKGVKIHMCVPQTGKKSFLKELRYAYNVKDTPNPQPLLYLVVDNTDFLLTNIANKKFDSEKELCIFGQSQDMVYLFRDMLNPKNEKQPDNIVLGEINPKGLAHLS